MPARAIRLGILLAGHLILTACYSPYEPDCGFVCGSGGTCPDDYTCNSADNLCHLNGSSPSMTCANAPLAFDVQSAASASNVAITVTFDGVPNPAQAQDLSNYSVPGLTLSGSTDMGGSITIGTSSQAAMSYSLTVTGITRLTDGAALKMNTATFTGRSPFEVLGAVSTSVNTVDVTFNDPPDPAAMTASNYTIPNLTVSSASLSGSVATLTTSTQAAQTYNLTVDTVKRQSDGEPLHTSTAQFGGRNAFDVASATTVDATHVSVVFDAAPAPTQATTVGNYAIPGLSVTAASLAGSTVTLTTSVQRAISYTVTVANVTRASDAETLTTTSAPFTGTDYCTDIMLDGDETDADCGGPTCTARCGMGLMCSLDTDCTSTMCSTTCQ
jgi:hypothetical protein